jgi:GT2 family glycosyltransferase
MLARQDVAEPFEVLICDDGSDDATPDVAHRMAAHLPYPLRYLRRERDGGRPGAARNMGLRAARGTMIVLLDDDMLVPPQFLRVHRERLVEPDGVTLGYIFQFAPAEGLGLGFTILPDWRDFGVVGVETLTLGEAGLQATLDLAAGGNIALSRSLVEVAGGFDETFCGWGAEDTEYLYRLCLLGAELRTCLEAFVWHHSEPGNPWLRRERGLPVRLNAYLANLGHFCGKYPDVPELQTWATIVAREAWLQRGDDL